VTNPPYGERISTPDLLGTYKMIGERLKHQFQGNDAWVLSYREECFDQIGLKPSIKIPLYNGSLECEFRKYQMFQGKLSGFRAEGGIIKSEDEKRQMAEKHRFKKEREFKKRLSEQEENEEADIRSFKFHSLERKIESEKPASSPRKRDGGYGDREFGKRDSGKRDSGKKGFGKRDSGKRDFGKKDFGKRDFGKKDFGKKNRRFDHDEDDD
jgi:putative N6-adenine-specific DNA methylase